MSTHLVSHSIYRDHLTPRRHPECPERYGSILAALAPLGLPIHQAKAATEAELTLCHSPDYIQLARHEIESGRSMLSTGDVNVCLDSYKVALFSTGGVLTGVDAVINGLARNVFCLVRPPGHHATRAEGMGFCIFNNVAVAARYAQLRYGIERVLIVDWDLHHGNGTQDIFYYDPSVYYFSTHEKGNYPGTGSAAELGEGDGYGTTLNCPIQSGGNSRLEVMKAFRERLVPAMDRFRPQLILISAGFDSREGDPLGEFNLKDEDFAELTRIVKTIADKHAGGRIVSALEGGYNLKGIGKAAYAHVTALMK